MDVELKEIDEKKTSPDVLFSNDVSFHRSGLGPESLGLWHSGPSSLSFGQNFNNNPLRLVSVNFFLKILNFSKKKFNNLKIFFRTLLAFHHHIHQAM